MDHGFFHAPTLAPFFEARNVKETNVLIALTEAIGSATPPLSEGAAGDRHFLAPSLSSWLLVVGLLGAIRGPRSVPLAAGR